MMQIKKELTIKVIALLIAITFSCLDFVYSKDIFSLRVPVTTENRKLKGIDTVMKQDEGYTKARKALRKLLPFYIRNKDGKKRCQ